MISEQTHGCSCGFCTIDLLQDRPCRSKSLCTTAGLWAGGTLLSLLLKCRSQRFVTCIRVICHLPFLNFISFHPTSLQDSNQNMRLGLGLTLGTVVIFPVAASCTCTAELCDHSQTQSQLHLLTLSIYI